MSQKEIIATSAAKVTLNSDGNSKTVDLYSPEGMEMISALWLKLCCENRVMYEPTWLGIPIIQFPTDMVMMQELIWKVRPDVIIETGIAHGGSLVFHASLCELMGKGRVIGVDIEIRKYNEVAIRAHSMAKRIELIEGSSIDSSIVELVKKKVEGAKTVLMVLDSNHTYEHVREELKLYHSIVTPDSYIVAMDGAEALIWDIPRGKKEWKEHHALRAIHEFLKSHPEFEIDPRYTRMKPTSSPDGFLRRRTPEELNRK